jgi:C-terminal processing protease CtpA/Prc
MMAGAVRTLHCTKVAGQPTGIGLVMDNEGRSSIVILVDHVQEGSVFSGQIQKDDEIVEVNGESFHGNAYKAAKAIMDASDLTLKVQTPKQMVQVMPLKSKSKGWFSSAP